jgi:hypothetical protein
MSKQLLAIAGLLLFSCQKDDSSLNSEFMRTYTVKAGKHDFWPPELRTPYNLNRLEYLEWVVIFDASCAYHLPGEDQKDFNKGGGISFDLLSNTRNAVMWAWRYNPQVDQIELCGYWHNAGIRYIGEGPELWQMRVNFGERVKVRIYRQGQSWRVKFTRLDVDKEPMESVEAGQVIYTGKYGYRIGLWFGGNLPAPTDMEVWYDFKKV